jgi:XapX domain-containing protein
VVGYLVSLVMGLAVGVAYGLVQVRSPAPPLIALIGLLGMVLGEEAIDLAMRHASPFPHASIERPSGDARGRR